MGAMSDGGQQGAGHGPDAAQGERPEGRRGGADGDRVVIVTQDGMGVASTADDEDGGERNPAELVEQPAKVMRIGSMIKQLLDEVRSAPLDQAGRARLAEIHERSIIELEKGLAPELVDELRRIALPFGDGETPSDAELRIAQAQLVGWLEGLFHGIQTALMAQQMAARAQLDEMRRALPMGHGPGMPGQPGQPGHHPMPGMPGQPGHEGPAQGTGQYL
jgi:Protein of unknown function (DUF2587)